MPGMENSIACTPLSIEIDLVYSENRMFDLQFTAMNPLDTFSGDNAISVSIVENGTIEFTRG